MKSLSATRTECSHGSVLSGNPFGYSNSDRGCCPLVFRPTLEFPKCFEMATKTYEGLPSFLESSENNTAQILPHTFLFDKSHTAKPKRILSPYLGVCPANCVVT